MNPTKEFRDYMISQGAALVGIGDLTAVPSTDYPVGIAVAVPLPKHVIKDLQLAPTREYYELYTTLNDKLNAIVTAGEEYLTGRGYQAYAQTTDRVTVDSDKRSPLPHKTVATRAGLGWIGKNNLLVTPQYGSAVRISSLLTDAQLTCDAPITHSRCGACHACVRYCPAHALKNTLWHLGMPREDIVSVSACYKKQREIMRKSTGIDTDLCGKCFAVCTYTKQYLKQNSNMHNKIGI